MGGGSGRSRESSSSAAIDPVARLLPARVARDHVLRLIAHRAPRQLDLELVTLACRQRQFCLEGLIARQRDTESVRTRPKPQAAPAAELVDVPGVDAVDEERSARGLDAETHGRGLIGIRIARACERLEAHE